ncbi:MAG: hypothetical protein ABI684_01730, partial [Nitrospirota bacterium]
IPGLFEGLDHEATFELRRDLLDRFMLSTQVSMTQSGELLKVLSDGWCQPVKRRLAHMTVGHGGGIHQCTEVL